MSLRNEMRSGGRNCRMDGDSEKRNARNNLGKLPPPEIFKINAPKCGPLTVIVEGHRCKSETVVLTFHDVGTNTKEVRDFLTQPAMSALAPRVVWVHVTAPGQEDGAGELELPPTGYPKIQDLAEALPVVLDQLNITSVVVLGTGAGSNILLRFCVLARDRVLGAVLLNCTASSAGFLEAQREKAAGRKISRSNSVSHSSESHLAFLHFGAKSDSGHSESFESIWQHFCDYLRGSINPRNLFHYMNSYFERDNLLPSLPRLTCPVLLIAGARSEYAHTVHSLNAAMQRAFKNSAEKRRQMEFLRVDDVVSPLHERPEKLAECLQYFLQGLGLLGSLSPVFLLAPVRAEPFSKPAIIEFRSQLEEAESGGQAARAADDNVQPSRPPPGARARRMSMQEYDMPRGAESFRAYGAQRIAGVRTASISE